MALYSVWDWNRNAYRVYATSTPVSVGDDPKPPKPVVNSPIGASPDTDIKALPAGAKFLGYDAMARGEIRRAPNGPGDLGDDAGISSAERSSGLAVAFVAGMVSAYMLSEWYKRRRVRSNRRR